MFAGKAILPPNVRLITSSARQLVVPRRTFATSQAQRWLFRNGAKKTIQPNTVSMTSEVTPTKHPLWRRFPVTAACIGLPVITMASLGLVVAMLLAYDASTYQDRHVDNVPLSPMALEPERGGPKNLPIAQYLVDDDTAGEDIKKEKLVIVGGGWGAVGILKHLDPERWHVTVVSPENYFIFHPLLPSATVGTVEVRSLVEPLRKIVARVKGHYLQASALDIDMSERLVELKGTNPGDEPFYLPYDRLVIACGAVNATHGVSGLENCHQLKTVADALAIRRKIMGNLEKAALPSTSEAERQRLMTYVVCGGGPTGVEFASELFDMVNEDVLQYMPKILRKQIRVNIIQSRDHILNTYSQKISEYAEAKFQRDEINTILNARVKSVGPDSVTYTTKDANGKSEDHTITTGFTLWSTGLGMNPFTTQVASLLPNQYHKHALEVDAHLRVLGAPLGTVYALGDCATIETNLVDHLLDVVDKCDTDKDGKIDEREFEHMMAILKRKFPTSQVHVEKIKDIFAEYAHGESVIGMNDLGEMFINLSKKMTALPATAQVANQQGEYLGRKLSKIAQKGRDTLNENYIQDDDDLLSDPFHYKHLGSLAYIGNSAVFDYDGKFSFAGGLMAMYMWRSIYWSEQVSFRNRVLLMLDWVKRGIWGRDLSKF